MITDTGRTSSNPGKFGVCKIDFEIWDRVLAARPGWKLETISGEVDRKDAAEMFSLVDASRDRQLKNG